MHGKDKYFGEPEGEQGQIQPTTPPTRTPVPTLGQSVLYRLTEGDVRCINTWRDDAHIAKPYLQGDNPGYQMHVGNDVHPGRVVPMTIVAVWGSEMDSLVNGQCLLDGNDSLWVTSVRVGEGHGTFSWPEWSY